MRIGAQIRNRSLSEAVNQKCRIVINDTENQNFYLNSLGKKSWLIEMKYPNVDDIIIDFFPAKLLTGFIKILLLNS